VLLYGERYFLSPREIDVLGYAVEGAQDKHIAERHSCSRSTVSTYWRRIFIKTGVRPQREVLAHLLRFACTLAVAPQPKRVALGVLGVHGPRTAEAD
jgi:DNA-binding CsgD family transcriptional regulator